MILLVVPHIHKKVAVVVAYRQRETDFALLHMEVGHPDIWQVELKFVNVK